MKKQLKKIIGLLMLFVLYGFNAYSQNPTYIMEIKNDVAVSPTEYTFDIYINNTSTNATYIPTWELFGLQAGIKINKAILNGGVITPTIVAGFSDLLPSNQQTNANLFMAGFTNGIPNEFYGLKMTVKAAAGVGTGTPITATEMRVCRIKLTNTVPFNPYSYANLTWNFTSSPWQTKISFYKPVATNITVQANHIITNRNNPPLNTSSTTGPTIHNVTGGGSYCAGTSPTGVSVGLSSSEVTYSYQLYKYNVAEGLPKAGTGAALSWNNLTAGIYTVKATDTANTAMNGSATIIAPLTPIQQTITISASSNPSFQGDPVTFTATVTPAVAGQILNPDYALAK